MSNLSTSADIMDVCAVECVRNMPEKRAWDPRETEELIAIFKQCSWLWDPESHHYRDKIKTIETYDNIAKNFNTTPQEVHKKLLNLRKHFNNEWRRCRSRKCHKPGFEDIPGSSWQHFHSLLFLKTVQKNRELVTKEEMNVNDSTEDYEMDHENMLRISAVSTNLLQYHNSDAEGDIQFNGIAREDTTEEELQSYPEVQEDVKPYRSMERDDFDIFGAFVASELRSLKDPALQKRLKIRIQKAILDMYTEEDTNDYNKYVQQT